MTCPVCKQPMTILYRVDFYAPFKYAISSRICSIGCAIDFLISREAAEITKGTNGGGLK